MYIRPHHRASDIFIWIYVLCTASNYAIIKAKSAPHLEPCVNPPLLERTVAVKRTRIRSAPQNAVLSRAAQGSQTQGFQNHIPARGRKHELSLTFRKLVCTNFKTTSPQGDGNHNNVSGKRSLIPISKPHPRKGTETNAALIIVPPISLKFQNHIPARGRKRYRQGLHTWT